MILVGLVLGAIGLGVFTLLGVHTTYAAPSSRPLIVSFGMGLSFVALSSTSLIGVEPADAGVASALVNTTQQTGSSWVRRDQHHRHRGDGVLPRRARNLRRGRSCRIHSRLHHWFAFSAIVLAIAAASAFALVRAPKAASADEDPELVAVPAL